MHFSALHEVEAPDPLLETRKQCKHRFHEQLQQATGAPPHNSQGPTSAPESDLLQRLGWRVPVTWEGDHRRSI